MAAYTEQERALVGANFDAAFYRLRNPDLRDLDIDLLDHFLDSGWREGRDPTANFSVADYLDLNHDVADLGINPFLHWLRSGEAENRQTRIDLGFRYRILRGAPSLEARLEISRPAPQAADPVDGLEAVLDRLDRPSLYLTVSHDEYVGRVGGVQACLQREAEAVRAAGWSHLHLYPTRPLYVTDFETSDPVIGLVADGEPTGAWRASQIAAALGSRVVAGRFARTGFAVHSLLGHNVAAVTLALKAGGARRGFFWLHDQTSLCASYALLRNDVEYCGAPPPDSPACGICIYGRRRQVQMAEHAALFSDFDLTAVAPSRAMLDHWTAKAPYDYAGAQAHPHATLEPAGPAPAEPGGPLRIAFLGFPYPHKGWPIFRALAERYAGRGYEFLHLGQEPDADAPVRHVSVVPRAGEGSAMVEAVIAQGVDVAMILSICPETFSFTAHEAVAGGAAVVAFADSLAVARFVADADAGLVAADEQALYDLFETREIETLARRVRQPALHHMRLSRMTADLLEPAL